MSIRSFGFLEYQRPKWEQYYEEAEENGVLREITKETNVSKEQIKKVLEMLYEYRVIN